MGPFVRLSSVAAALAVLAVPLAAHATITVSVNGSAATFNFGAAECKNNTTAVFSWDLGTSYVTGTDIVTLRGSKSSSCTANTVDKTYSVPTTAQTGSLTINLADFIFDLAGGCSGAVTSGSPGVAYFCVSYAASGATTATDSGSAILNYALTPPVAPTSLSAGGGNNLIRLTWAQGSSADSIRNYDVFAVASGTPISLSDSPASSQVVGTSVKVLKTDDGSALVNQVPYDLAVLARDTFGNTSGLSSTVTATPVAVDDFYSYYRREGGVSEGGCASAPLGPLSLLGLFAFRRRARTRRLAGRRSAPKNRGPFLVGGTLLLVLLSTAGAARADIDIPLSRHAPRRLLFAAKFDKYDPQVDSEAALVAAGNTPYHDIFGTRVPWRAQFEADVVLLHFYGSFLLGGTVGFWQNIGHGREVISGNASGDTTLLNVIPLGVVATYRFDWLCDQVRWFPLIPYAQAGLSAANWASKDATGSVTDSQVPGKPGQGSGWTKGYTTALGVAFDINSLSPGIASEAYIDMGLQRTSLFFEYGWTRLDGFRNGTSLILSDKGPRFGLSLEF